MTVGGGASPEGAPPVPPTEPPDSPGRRRLSRRARRVLRELHQRTWELEFLMSGALAVGLGQLPARVDTLFARVFPRLGETAGLAAMLGYQYVKLILYTLILTFIVHVVLRAFWVSLIGLDSVFPRGVRWDRLRLGPVTRETLRRELPSVRQLIVKTDGVASVLFAAAFYVVAVFLLSVGLVVVVGVPLLVLIAFSPWAPSPTTVLLVAAVGLSVALTAPVLLDRLVGDRLDPEGWVAGWIRGTMRFNLHRLGLVTYGPAQYTLTSQIGARRAGLLLAGAMVAITGLFLVRDILVARDRLQFGALPFMPEVVGAAGVDPRYYESSWADRLQWDPIPSIPGDVFTEEEPYLRLFVPFRPSADVDAVAAICPELEPVARTGFRMARPHRGVQTDTLDDAIARSLACASRLWSVTVDGAPVAEPPVFAVHPRTRLAGLAWYVDTRPLASGRHLLTVRRGSTAHGIDVAELDDPRPPIRHEIPFWR